MLLRRTSPGRWLLWYQTPVCFQYKAHLVPAGWANRAGGRRAVNAVAALASIVSKRSGAAGGRGLEVGTPGEVVRPPSRAGGGRLEGKPDPG